MRISNLHIEPMGKRHPFHRQKYKLIKPLIATFTHEEDGFDLCVIVPSGFDTDFASSPWFLWWVFPPRGDWDEAAIVHDYMYRKTQAPRHFADSVFRLVMLKCGVSWWKRLQGYFAVRVFGGWARKVKVSGDGE